MESFDEPVGTGLERDDRKDNLHDDICDHNVICCLLCEKYLIWCKGPNWLWLNDVPSLASVCVGRDGESND